MAIVYLRAIAIIFIVFHHSISTLTGWPPADIGSHTVPEFVITASHYAKFFGLYTFTLISGFLIGSNRPTITYARYMYYKAKKILIPCFISGIAYYVLFPDYIIGDPINGTHLLYLPMIFVLYMLGPILNANITYRNSLILLVAYFSLWGGYKIADQRFLIEGFYYMGAFILGGYLARLKNCTVSKELIFLGFVIVLLLDTFIKSFIAICLFVVLFYLWLRVQISEEKFVQTSIWIRSIIVISKASMLIYILHQFVINFIVELYLSNHFIISLLPFMCFFLSLLIPTMIYYFYSRVKMLIKEER